MSNYSIKIYYDYDAENPWTNRDDMTMLYTDWGRNFWQKSYAWFDFYKLAKDKINKDNAYKIIEVIGYTKEQADIEVSDNNYIDIVECTIDRLYDESPDIKQMETILDILWYNTYRWTSKGYSQGDCIDCLLVSDDKDYNFDDDVKLFNARAWWDVYGYNIIEHKPLYNADGTLSHVTDDEVIDSCWWYYWDDWLEQIRDEVKKYVTKEQFDEAKDNIIAR